MSSVSAMQYHSSVFIQVMLRITLVLQKENSPLRNITLRHIYNTNESLIIGHNYHRADIKILTIIRLSVWLI